MALDMRVYSALVPIQVIYVFPCETYPREAIWYLIDFCDRDPPVRGAGYEPSVYIQVSGIMLVTLSSGKEATCRFS